MKNLIVLVCLAFTLPLMAQNTNANKNDTDAAASLEHSLEDYERYFEAATKMKFREFVIGSLDLNQSEIIAFDPIFRDYFRDKNEILENRIKLVNNYKTQMKKDVSVESNNEESYDFIQNFWDLTTDNTELQKNYFEKFKNELGWQKAFKFFILEEAAQNRVILDKSYEIFPEIEKIYYYPLKNHNSLKKMHKQDKVENDMSSKKEMNSDTREEMVKNQNKKSYVSSKENLSKGSIELIDDQGADKTSTDETIKLKQSEAKDYAKKSAKTDVYAETDGSSVYKRSPKIPVETYIHWVEHTTDTVSLEHTYTYNGIILLSNALESLVMHKNTGFDKGEIIKKAYNLTLDPYSTEHADYTSEIFLEIASTYGMISSTPQMSKNLTKAASMIDPDILLTRQANHIKNFFVTANEALMTIGYLLEENQASSQGTK